MNRSEKIIIENKQLINRFIDLMMCRDHIYDSRHQWFYSLVPKDKLETLLYLTSEDDVRQEIYLYIIECITQYKRSDKEFSNWLKKGIGWRLRDYCAELISLQTQPIFQSQTKQPALTLEWVFSKQKNLPLTQYEKYVLYLYLGRNETITHIAQLTYQDRKTIQQTLKDIFVVLKENK